VCVLSVSDTAPVTEDISASIAQPLLKKKKLIAFSVALFFVCSVFLP